MLDPCCAIVVLVPSSDMARVLNGSEVDSAVPSNRLHASAVGNHRCDDCAGAHGEAHMLPQIRGLDLHSLFVAEHTMFERRKSWE
eukprot:9846919-Alexandrium_andersonii.AAC.1